MYGLYSHRLKKNCSRETEVIIISVPQRISIPHLSWQVLPMLCTFQNKASIALLL